MANRGSRKKTGEKQFAIRDLEAIPANARLELWKDIEPFVAEEGMEPNGLSLARSLICESDRGRVLVAAAVLDTELESLFRTVFQLNSDIKSEEMSFLLTQRPQPPLQSTAIKARLAFALGFISRPLCESILELQSLRSRVAAHSKDHFELTTDHLRKITSRMSPEMRQTLIPSRETLKAFCVTMGMSVDRFAFVVIVGRLYDLLRNHMKMINNQQSTSSKKQARDAHMKIANRDSVERLRHSSRKSSGT